MVGTTVPWRVLIPVVAIGLGVVVEHSTHHAPLHPQPPLPILEVQHATAPAPVEDLPPLPITIPFDLRGALAKIGHRFIDVPQPASAHPDLISADGACTRPTAEAKKRLVARVAEWVDTKYSDEKSGAAAGLALRFGCVDPNSIIVDGSVDRRGKDSERMSLQRSWVLEITPDHIVMLAERTSSPSEDWMEWADEGTLRVDALIDLDHDGTRDAVVTNEEHEGGAMRSQYTVSVRRAGKLVPVLTMSGVLAISLEDHQVLLSLGDNLEHAAFRCLGAKLELASCAPAEAARTHAEIMTIANNMIYDPALDKELLAEQLQKLRVPAAERAPILAAASETTPAQRAERHVIAFLDHRPDGDLRNIDLGLRPDARQLFADVRSQLGDAPCVKSQLSNETSGPAIDRWIAAQHPAKKERLVVTGACDDYVWAAWNVGDTRVETLLFANDADIQRVVEFRFSNIGDEATPGTGHAATFFRHGNTVIGEVIHLGEKSNELLAVANGKIVGRRRGAFELYRFDPRWADASDDLVTDQKGWWHATPEGLERIDGEALLPHETQRRALETVEPFDASHAKQIANALTTLGAEPALVKEVRALTP